MGSHIALAVMTPHRVATNAPAIRWPSLAGSLRFSSTWIRPSTVPMMPIVGARAPMSVNIFTPTLS